MGNLIHRIAGNNGVAALEPLRAVHRGTAGRRCAGDTEHITRKNDAGIGDLRVGGNKGIKGNPKPLGNKIDGIAGSNGVTRLETGRAVLGDAAAGGASGHAELIAGVNEVGIGYLRVCRDQSFQAHPKTLGNKIHGIAGNYRIASLKTGWAVPGHAAPFLPLPGKRKSLVITGCAGTAVMSDHEINLLSILK